MKVEFNHNHEPICPDGWRWVAKGEKRHPGDRFAFREEWVEITSSFGLKQLSGFELIRKIQV